VTIVFFICFYEFFLANEYDKKDLNSSLRNHHKTNLEHFDLLNNTLSALKKELQLIYKHREDNVAPEKENNFMPTNLTIISKTYSTKVLNKKMNINDKYLSPVKSISRKQKRGLLYTMDSISSYETASKNGGAAGELLIRHSLENMFKELNVLLDVKTSDEGALLHFIILDPWTYIYV
jgi:hypothetical protein